MVSLLQPLPSHWSLPLNRTLTELWMQIHIRIIVLWTPLHGVFTQHLAGSSSFRILNDFMSAHLVGGRETADFLAIVWSAWFLPHPPPPHPTPIFLAASCLSFAVFLCDAGRVYWRGGGRSPINDHKKAWSSINHSILSGCGISLAEQRVFPMLNAQLRNDQTIGWDICTVISKK